MHYPLILGNVFIYVNKMKWHRVRSCPCCPQQNGMEIFWENLHASTEAPLLLSKRGGNESEF